MFSAHAARHVQAQIFFAFTDEIGGIVDIAKAQQEISKKYAVPALDKCFEIFQFLASSSHAYTQSEIAKGVGRSTNEIFRILVNLEMNGYLRRDATSGKYRLSFKLYNLSRSISPLDELRQQSIPLMDDLAHQTGLSCQLSILHQSQTMVLVHARSPGPVSLSVAEGAVFSTLESNAGKVLLAHSNDEVRRLIFERDLTWHSMSDMERQTFINTLNDIQMSSSYSGSTSYIPGVIEHVALVGKNKGKQIGALSLSKVESVDAKGFSEMDIDALETTALNISTILGL